MPSNIDPSVMDRDGPIAKSAERSPTSTPGIQEQLAAAKDEIDGLMGGQLIDFSGLANRVPELTDKFIFRTASATYYAALSQIRDSSLSGRILTAPALGIVGDGVANDSAALNQAIATWSAAGGAYMLLRPADAGYFNFGATIFLRSNVVVQFIGPPVRLAKGASFILNGKLALNPAVNRFRLLSDRTAGQTELPIDTSPPGGGPVSDFFATGDYLVIDGLTDSAGNSYEYQEVRVTNVDDGTQTLTVTPALAYDFAAVYDNADYEAFSGQSNRTLISKQVVTLLTGNVAIGDRIMPVTAATLGQFQAGDYVHVLDDELSTSGEPVNLEPTRVVGVEIDGANTISLDRSIHRAMTTANRARLVKLDPIVGAGIWGASVLYTESPDAVVHPFEMRRAAACTSGECQLTNADAFGYKGNGFRIWGSIGSRWDSLAVLNPRHLAEGEGVASSIAYSRDCYVSRLYATGCRRDCYAVGSTNATFQDIESIDNQYRSLGTAGLRESGTLFSSFRLSGGGEYASTSKAAISIGSTLHLAGSFDTSISSGKIQNWGGADTYAIEFLAPSEDILCDSLEIQDCAVAIIYSDQTGDGTLVASNFRMQDCHFNNIQSWIVDIDGGRNGSTTRTLEDFILKSCHFVACSKMFSVVQADTFKMFNCVIDQVEVDNTEPYLVKAVDVTDLTICGGYALKAKKGFSVTDCPNFRLLDMRLLDQQGSTEVLFDGGGCDGGYWGFVTAIGFIPTADLSGGSTITFDPFPIGGHYLTDS